MSIIERTPGMSNLEMWEQCELLKKILDTKVERTIGRGTKTLVNKYDTHQSHYTKISNSVTHYKNLFMTETQETIQYRPYQLDIIKEGAEKLKAHGFIYLAMEVRTGKTLTSLGIADKLKVNKVLFITKKKAISSIESDYTKLKPNYLLKVINYESLHLTMDLFRWDLVILDEAHSCFLGNTLIDGVKIKDIKVGDFINSFNFVDNKYETKKVLNVYENELSENLVKIKCNGKEIVCTESHKIFTKHRGWVEARHITSEDELQIL